MFVEFLKRLMHGLGKMFLSYCEGHPGACNECIPREDEGKLRLLYLPPYSPQLNHVWNDVKKERCWRVAYYQF